MPANQGQQLEIYSSNHPQEVLLVKLKIDDELDEVMIFKGFSSSLMRSTAFDPDVPVISDRAEILSIDRLAAPYKPNQPNYLQQGITWEEFFAYL
ncbi:hypothetical protein [Pseudanabaena sp. BC1403]|uniref:DUF7734 family protein n=1 Tax=Pseudanabaena sp. BC1403 TaxID=2043171 RepID=UPI000CD9104E|nr:hypothetical protein [Pseudanabaena sp. BC1403]